MAESSGSDEFEKVNPEVGTTNTNPLPNANEISEDVTGHVRAHGHVPVREERAPHTVPLPSVVKEEHYTSTLIVEDRIVHSPAVEGQVRKEIAQNPPSRTPLANGESTKKDKEMARLKAVLAETSPDVAQRILRERWRVFLFEQYNEDHIAFILRAGLKNSNGAIIEKVLKDEGVFKEPFFTGASRKQGVVVKALESATSTQLLQHVPEAVLDRAISERLKDVPAKRLITWLAEADRLGYKLDDILDEEDESVVPKDTKSDVEMTDEVIVIAVPQNTAPRNYAGQNDVPRYVAAQNGASLSNLALPFKDPLLVEQEKNAIGRDLAESAKQELARRHVTRPQTNQAAARSYVCKLCGVQIPTFQGYNYVSMLPYYLAREY